MPYVNHRWLGGMLTNFKTIRQSIKRLKELEEMQPNGTLEQAQQERSAVPAPRDGEARAAASVASRTWAALPDALFVIDVGHEHIAVHEANKLGIPVVGVVDTNCSPDGVDYVIPGNDDAIRAIQLYAGGIADAVLEGRSRIPEVPAGEDEFVELDEEGKPKEKPVPQRAQAPPPYGASRLRSAASAARQGASVAMLPKLGRGGRDGDRAGEAAAPAARKSADARSRPILAGDGATRPHAGVAAVAAAEAVRSGDRSWTITAEAVKELRERTGAGMMECKKALVETGGDLDAAVELLRKPGLAKADKKAARVAAEGVIVIERSRRRPDGAHRRGQLRNRFRGPRDGFPGLRRCWSARWRSKRKPAT